MCVLTHSDICTDICGIIDPFMVTSGFMIQSYIAGPLTAGVFDGESRYFPVDSCPMAL